MVHHKSNKLRRRQSVYLKPSTLPAAPTALSDRPFPVRPGQTAEVAGFLRPRAPSQLLGNRPLLRVRAGEIIKSAYGRLRVVVIYYERGSIINGVPRLRVEPLDRVLAPGSVIETKHGLASVIRPLAGLLEGHSDG